MWDRYSQFLRKPPEVMVTWHDPETEARGWMVMNSLRGGAAGGGTRMRVGANAAEVTYLAKVMEMKFALSGPPIGGAKSAIDFDPTDPRKHGVLRRWFQAISPYLRSCYGTGGDLNVDEVTEVVPITRELGLEHPQEGVVRGHLRPDEDRFRQVIHTLDDGVEAPVTGDRGVPGHCYAVADMLTGYGVARSLIRYWEGIGRSLDGVRVIAEGFGNVGAPAALYLARAGARVVAIADAEKSLVVPDGLDATDVERLMVEGHPHMLPDDDRCRSGDDHDAYFDAPADILVCAAASGTLTPARLDRLERAGVGTIVAGANLPFQESELGSVAVNRDADERFAVLPDFVVNLGMARGFSYFMEGGASPTAEAAFRAVDETVEQSVGQLLDRAPEPDRRLMGATLGLALDRIGAA